MYACSIYFMLTGIKYLLHASVYMRASCAVLPMSLKRPTPDTGTHTYMHIEITFVLKNKLISPAGAHLTYHSYTRQCPPHSSSLRTLGHRHNRSPQRAEDPAGTTLHFHKGWDCTLKERRVRRRRRRRQP